MCVAYFFHEALPEPIPYPPALAGALLLTAAGDAAAAGAEYPPDPASEEGANMPT